MKKPDDNNVLSCFLKVLKSAFTGILKNINYKTNLDLIQWKLHFYSTKILTGVFKCVQLHLLGT